ncbi:hypothetical protein CHS0354_024915 [Potamilus streckersoni]|uniref:Vacuolar protein sorting-associated protein 72 homolog n=1 Tax=Potamilus streckersoni TaxID=2493646 RepID=A0AAE0VQ17_9BIVA|nr:hypothetical protein CHS0354_024915 [Potamilus streckersoni]
MAATRDRRSNAGSKMSRLLEAEDDDDFYKTTYGGFSEEADDIDYHTEDSESEDTDSDISIDENDEVKSDVEEDEPKRMKGVVTKAYKEPANKPSADAEKKPREKKKKKPPEWSSVQIYHSPQGKKAVRQSTSNLSQSVALRQQERDARAKMLKEIAAAKKVPEVRRLTQEELLEEAKITEEMNLKSVENFYKMELEKKKARVQKSAYRGPMIRYHSTTMPLIEDITAEMEINVEGDGEQSKKEESTNSKENIDKCSRTFIIFTDERTFKDYFPKKKIKPPNKQYCPVTRLPAKYFDPVTNTPYATIQAFRLIREAYAQQIQSEENLGEQRKKQKIDSSQKGST